MVFALTEYLSSCLVLSLVAIFGLLGIFVPGGGGTGGGSGGGGGQTTTITAEPTSTTTSSTSSSSSSSTICTICDCVLGTDVPMPPLNDEDEALSNVDPDWPLRDINVTSFPLPAESDDIPEVPDNPLAKGALQYLYSDESDLLGSDNSTTAHFLSKRYSACGLVYENLNYPSTAMFANSMPPPANSADLVQQIVKWVDYELLPGVGGACTWRLLRFPNRQGMQEYASKSSLPLKALNSIVLAIVIVFMLCMTLVLV